MFSLRRAVDYVVLDHAVMARVDLDGNRPFERGG
jgi:hypothetical protein